MLPTPQAGRYRTTTSGPLLYPPLQATKRRTKNERTTSIISINDNKLQLQESKERLTLSLSLRLAGAASTADPVALSTKSSTLSETWRYVIPDGFKLDSKQQLRRLLLSRGHHGLGVLWDR